MATMEERTDGEKGHFAVPTTALMLSVLHLRLWLSAKRFPRALLRLTATGKRRNKEEIEVNTSRDEAADGVQTLAMATAQACPQISTSCCCPNL